MSDQMSLWDIPNATSLLESADGRLPSSSPEYHRTPPSGLAPAHASLSARQATERGLMTKDTFGQLSVGSSSSVALQRSLESRLRQRLAGSGSPEYVLTWKHWGMPAGEPICALRASGRRTSGSDCSGWPTASMRDWKDTPGMAIEGTNPDGSTRKRLDQLPRVAAIAGYPTPTVTDSRRGTQYSPLAPNMTLNMAAVLTHGLEPSGSTAQTEKRGGLNPALSRWLMGYPVAWCQAAIRAHRAMPKTRRKREK